VRPQHEMTDSDLAVAGVRYDRCGDAGGRITCAAKASVRDLAGAPPAARDARSP